MTLNEISEAGLRLLRSITDTDGGMPIFHLKGTCWFLTGKPNAAFYPADFATCNALRRYELIERIPHTGAMSTTMFQPPSTGEQWRPSEKWLNLLAEQEPGFDAVLAQVFGEAKG